MPRQLRVFLCHASQDKPAVRELYQRLKSEDWIDPWLDEEKLYPGQNWDLEIEKAAEASDVVLVCLSNNSINKRGYIQKELRFVLDIALEIPEDDIFIIPLRLEECIPHRSLRDWQYLDYFPEKNKDKAYRRLLSSLQLRLTNIENSSDSASPLNELGEQIPQNNLNPKNVIKQNYVVDEKKSGLIYGVAKYMNLGLLVFGLTLVAIFFLDYLVKNPIFSLTDVPKTETPTLAVKIDSPTYLSAQPDFIPTLESTETPSPIPTLGIGSTMISEKDGMAMVYVPSGEFTMGSDGDDSFNECQKISICQRWWFDDVKPPHKLDLNAYWVDKTEVSNSMYSKCVDDGDCKPPFSTKYFTYYDDPKFYDYPVVYVTWNQAKDYCSWAGRNLPTEAQWEKAARGQDTRNYPWGENISCDYANYRESCRGGITSIGSYPNGASIYGALDMVGNVQEWVSSLYRPYPYYANDGRENLSTSGSRVVRGGSWNSFYAANITQRGSHNRDNSYSSLGFRCAMDATP